MPPQRACTTHLYHCANVAEHSAAKPATGLSWSLLGTLSGISDRALFTRLSSSAEGSAACVISTVRSWLMAADWPFQLKPAWETRVHRQCTRMCRAAAWK